MVGSSRAGLAGATADVHSFDLRTGEWSMLKPQGEPPSPRAAHAATAVGSMVVVQVSTPSCIGSEPVTSVCMYSHR